MRACGEMGTPVWEADIEFHEAIAAASGNAVLAKVLGPVLICSITPAKVLSGQATLILGQQPDPLLQQRDALLLLLGCRL